MTLIYLFNFLLQENPAAQKSENGRTSAREPGFQTYILFYIPQRNRVRSVANSTCPTITLKGSVVGGMANPYRTAHVNIHHAKSV